MCSRVVFSESSCLGQHLCLPKTFSATQEPFHVCLFEGSDERTIDFFSILYPLAVNSYAKNMKECVSKGNETWKTTGPWNWILFSVWIFERSCSLGCVFLFHESFLLRGHPSSPDFWHDSLTHLILASVLKQKLVVEENKSVFVFFSRPSLCEVLLIDSFFSRESWRFINTLSDMRSCVSLAFFVKSSVRIMMIPRCLLASSLYRHGHGFTHIREKEWHESSLNSRQQVSTERSFVVIQRCEFYAKVVHEQREGLLSKNKTKPLTRMMNKEFIDECLLVSLLPFPVLCVLWVNRDVIDCISFKNCDIKCKGLKR